MTMMSATDVAIARAYQQDTLILTGHVNARLNTPYVAISDEYGLIEIQWTAQDAQRRVADVMRRVGA